MRRSQEERSSCRFYQSMFGSVVWDVCAERGRREVSVCGNVGSETMRGLKCAILNSPSVLRRFPVPRRLLLTVDVIAWSRALGAS
jgi:hypothetical protein